MPKYLTLLFMSVSSSLIFALQADSSIVEKIEAFFKLPLIQVIFYIATAVGIVATLMSWMRKVASKKLTGIVAAKEKYIIQNLTSLIAAKDMHKFNDAGNPSYKTTIAAFIEDEHTVDTTIGVFGSPGIGKSFLALEVAYHQATLPQGDHIFDVIWWIDAEDLSKKNIGPAPNQNSDLYRLAVVGQFGIDLASATWLPELINALRNCNYLLVFDNACDVGDGVIEKTIKEFKNTFFPAAQPNKNQKIIVTSRNKYWGNGISLKPWTLSEFSFYVERYFDEEKQDISFLNEGDTDEKLYHELNGLPLATTLACAYMVEKRCRPASYLELLNVEHTNYRHGISFNKAFDLSYRALGEDALMMLNLVSLLSPTEIPLTTLIKYAQENKGCAIANSVIDIKDFNVDKGLAQLKRYALITAENDAEHYAIHRLWQQAIRDLLVEKQSLTEIYCTTLGMLCRATDGFKGKDYTFYRSILPHIEMLASHYNEKEHSEWLAALVTLLRAAANYSFLIGGVAQAMRLNAQVIAIDPDNLKLLHEVGLNNSHNLILRDYCTEALKLAKAAFDYFSGEYNDTDKIKMTEKARQAIGKVQQREGNFDEAKRLFEMSKQWIEQEQRDQKTNEISTLKKELYAGLLHDLGSVWWEEGLNYKQSIEYFDEAIAFKLSINNGETKDLYINLSKMIKGVVLGLMGNYDAQYQTHKEVFEFLGTKDYEHRRKVYTAYYLLHFGWDKIGWQNRNSDEKSLYEDYFATDDQYAQLLEGDIKYTIIIAVVNLRKAVRAGSSVADEETAGARYNELTALLKNKNKERNKRFLDDGTVSVSAVLDYAFYLDEVWIDKSDHQLDQIKKVIDFALTIVTIKNEEHQELGRIVFNRSEELDLLYVKYKI